MLNDVDLAVAALFGIRKCASIVPVFNLNLFDVSHVPVIEDFISKDNPLKKYSEIHESMEVQMKHTDDEKLAGMEGTVCYVEVPNGKVIMWKCKPESNEEIQ